MTFWTVALMAALCLLAISAAFRLAVHAVREAADMVRPTEKQDTEEQRRLARRARRQLENFMRYDGSEQEEIAQ